MSVVSCQLSVVSCRLSVVGCQLSVVSGNEFRDEWEVGRVWRRGGRGHQLSGTKETWLAGPQHPAKSLEKSEKRGVQAARNGPSEDRKCCCALSGVSVD